MYFGEGLLTGTVTVYMFGLVAGEWRGSEECTVGEGLPTGTVTVYMFGLVAGEWRGSEECTSGRVCSQAP